VIAVLGAGGVGGLLAALLSRAGEEVAVVAREPAASTIGARGIHVASVQFGELRVRPRVLTAVADPDLLVIATKANELEPALARVAGAPGLVVPLLNGIEHVAWLRERLGTPVVAGSIRVQAERTAPGEVEHTSRFVRVEVADERGRPLVAALRRAGVEAAVRGPEAQLLWSKLVRLCALAATTAAYDLPLGAVRGTPELCDELRACVSEAVAVARAQGAQIDAAETWAELGELGPQATSSLRRDVAAGRAGELDAICGAVVRAGARAGVACPTIARLAAMIAARVGASG
jgi:2-dehydropantoate 2-reductase